MKNLQNIRAILWLVCTFGTLLVFGISVFVSFIMVDRPVHITCSSSDKLCRAYTVKIGTMFYHGMKAAKLESTNSEKSKKHADVIKKSFDIPKNTFYVDEIMGYTCKMVPLDVMSEYKSYILLKNGKKVILEQHQSMEQCKQACQKIDSDIKNWDYSKNITLVSENKK